MTGRRSGVGRRDADSWNSVVMTAVRRSLSLGSVLDRAIFTVSVDSYLTHAAVLNEQPPWGAGHCCGSIGDLFQRSVGTKEGEPHTFSNSL